MNSQDIVLYILLGITFIVLAYISRKGRKDESITNESKESKDQESDA